MNTKSKDVVRGYYTLHGFFNEMDDDKIMVGFIGNSPFISVRDGVTSTIDTHKELEAYIRSFTGVHGFSISCSIGRYYISVKKAERDSVVDIVAELNRCGTFVRLQTAIQPCYYPSETPMRVSVEVSELKYLVETYGQIVRNMSYTLEGKAVLRREIEYIADHSEKNLDENFYKTREGKVFAATMRMADKTNAKDMWFPSLPDKLKGTTYNPLIDYPPPTMAYEETNVFERVRATRKRKTFDKASDKLFEVENKKVMKKARID